MIKSLLIRADGNEKIGAGHIMRCISIGTEARKAGLKVVFVTADESFLSALEENKFEVCVLNTNFERMEDELPILVPFIKEKEMDAILLDSYYVTYKYMTELKKRAKLIYMDDILSFPYPVDVLINYNIYAWEEDYKQLYAQSELPRFLLGCKYVPLREEFQTEKCIDTKHAVTDVLFSTGGADPERMAIRFVEKVVSTHEFDGINFHIVLGSFEPDRDAIETISKKNCNIRPHSNVKIMSDLMLQCDLAISAAGSTLYELCACGVPTITYVLEDNQIYGAKEFSNRGIMINAGDDRKEADIVTNIINCMENIIPDQNRRKQMQNNGLRYINGKGTQNIIEGIVRRE